MALIKLAYRQEIRADSDIPFERRIHKASYEEFLLKSQTYNPGKLYQTFTQMKEGDGRANSLHYKTGFAVSGYIGSLRKKIPGLKDPLGQNLVFNTHRFELLESDIYHPEVHKAAIYYYTDTLTLLNQFGEQLLLAYGNRTTQPGETMVEDCFLLTVVPGLSIVSYTRMQ